MPLVFIKRGKVPAGEYLLFYRAAFRYEGDPPNQSPSRTPGSQKSSKVSDAASANNQQMDDAGDLA